MYLGMFNIDEYVPIPAATHRFSSGAAYAPTAITYSIYEEGSATGLDEDVDMTPASPFDAVTGAYYVRRQLTVAAGFELGKTYMVLIKATVDSVAAIEWHTFQIRAMVAEVTAARMGALTDWIDGGRLDLIIDAILADTADMQPKLGSPAGASISADIAAIEAQTDDIGVAGAGLTAVPWNAAWDAEVQSECTDALNAYDPPTNAEMELRTLAAADYTVVSDLGTVQTGDSFARLGAPAGASVSADIAAIEAQTDDIGAAGAGLTALASQASVDTIDNFLDTEIAAILALLDDARAEPGQGAPPVNPDVVTKIDYLYKAWRNKKVQDATTFELYNDAGNVVDQKAELSDDATDFTFGEMITGA